MATQSMAALLSASLPAAAPASTQQQAAASSSSSSSTAPAAAAGKRSTDAAKDSIPAELKGGLDVEAQIAVTGVEVDGMVVIKILKHALDFPTSDITGQLLGLDLNGTLEVSDSFPLPALPPSERGADEEKERAAHRAAHATYSAEMLRALKQISAVDSVVGAYFSSPSGAFFKPSLIDAVALYQSVGGRKGVVLVYDPTKSTQGTVSLRAFRFSSNFADAYAKGKFDTQSLIAHQLTPSTLLSELPVTLTSTSLLTAFLSSLPSAPSTTPNQPLSLNLPSSLLSSLQHTSQSLDDYRRESDSLSYNARDIARQKAKVEQLVHSGTSEEEARRIVRVPEEASRLNGLLMLGQADEFAKGMAGAAGGGVARMYASTQI